MIGVIARDPIAMGPFLAALQDQARSGVEAPHEDGYGIAVFTGSHWLNLHEQCPIWDNAFPSMSGIQGTVLILHARKASPGTPINLTKLHPFCCADEPPGVMFCQNGTIRKPERLSEGGNPSAIDTEKYFDRVIYHRSVAGDYGQALQDTDGDIRAMGGDPTSLNAFLSDGRELIAWKGAVLPENVNYHTLYVREGLGMAVVTTETFEMEGTGEWSPLEGLWRRSFK